MPIYEYVCNDCGHQHEALQKFSDAPLTVCPACAKDTLKKKISAPSFRLTGTGWYETDFKNDKKKTESKGDGEGKSDKKSDDKTAKAEKKTNGSGKEAAA